MANRLPGGVQGFLTWLTAQPAEARPPRVKSPLWFLVQALGMMAGGIAIGVAGLAAGIWWAVPAVVVAWILVTGGLSLFQTAVMHRTSHWTFLKTRSGNRLLGRLVCGLFLFKQFDQYRKEHMRHHSPRVQFTEEDEFTQFVIDVVGLHPGLPKAVLKRRLIAAFLSPVFHLRFLWRRIRASWLGESRLEAVAGVTGVAIAAAAGALSGAWLAVALLWVVPMVVTMQIATTVRTVLEHRMPESKDENTPTTYGTFVGEAPPATGLPLARRLVAWTGWWTRTLLYHVPCRIVFMSGDAPAHDLHHLYPASREWTDYVASRHWVVVHGDRRGRQLVEVWGVWTAIDECLEAISRSSLQYDAESAAPHPLAAA
jgi:fatty acid desaturase